MLAAMARARPDWSSALIGPVQTELNGLKRIPNVHLFGLKAHKDLPEYYSDESDLVWICAGPSFFGF
jgi:hypothetical protein